MDRRTAYIDLGHADITRTREGVMLETADDTVVLHGPADRAAALAAELVAAAPGAETLPADDDLVTDAELRAIRQRAIYTADVTRTEVLRLCATLAAARRALAAVADARSARASGARR